MATDINSINWIQVNRIDKDIKEWTGSGTTVTDNYIELANNGYIDYTLYNEGNTVVNSEYIKIGLDILSDISILNNYSDKLKIQIEEEYKSDDADFNKTISRTLSVTPSSCRSIDNYNHSVHLMSMLGKPVIKIHIRILNKTGTSIQLKWFGLYASQDISTYQYNQIAQESMVKYGTMIEIRTDDPVNPELGRMWLRVDLMNN